MRHQGLSKQQIRQMVQLGHQGMAIRTIANHVGCGYGAGQAYFKAYSHVVRD